MLLTVPVKLTLTDKQKSSLLASTYTFNSACDYVSKVAFEKRLFNKFKLQKEIYYDIREKFSLPAQVAIRVIGRVADTYKIDKQVQHKFKKTSSIELDMRSLSWNKLDTVSILTTTGRMQNLPVVFGEYANLQDKVIRNSAKLVYKNKNFYLLVAVEHNEPELQQHHQFLGVDMGITNIATTSEGKKYSGKQADEVREHYTDLRGRLQKVGTKSSKRHLKQISRKERLFKKNINHIISKQIVSYAKRHNLSIAIEDLAGFGATVRKKQRSRLGKWAFGELRDFIIYKAKLAGVAVILVDPAYTSQTCSECGHKEKANRKGEDFKCKNCGHKEHADINGAINIMNRAINALEIVEKNLPVFINFIRAVVNQPIVASKKRPPVKRMSNKSTTSVVGY